jgi:heme-degrading monooxygenase HmoA
MILQIATLNVKPGGEAEFHAAFKKVVPFVSNLR